MKISYTKGFTNSGSVYRQVISPETTQEFLDIYHKAKNNFFTTKHKNYIDIGLTTLTEIEDFLNKKGYDTKRILYRNTIILVPDFISPLEYNHQ